jgi:hypothetical protein
MSTSPAGIFTGDDRYLRSHFATCRKTEAPVVTPDTCCEYAALMTAGPPPSSTHAKRRGLLGPARPLGGRGSDQRPLWAKPTLFEASTLVLPPHTTARGRTRG